MKTLPLFILLFLGGVVFFGCKKNKPANGQTPNQHIIDSLHLDSLAMPYVGTYLVNGIMKHEWEQMVHEFYSTDTIINDTVTITRYDTTTLCLMMGFHPSDSSKGQNYIPEPLYPGTVQSTYVQGYIFPPNPNLYNNFTYSGSVYYYSVYQLSYPKSTTDSVYISEFAGPVLMNNYTTYLSGVKIH